MWWPPVGLQQSCRPPAETCWSFSPPAAAPSWTGTPLPAGCRRGAFRIERPEHLFAAAPIPCSLLGASYHDTVSSPTACERIRTACERIPRWRAEQTIPSGPEGTAQRLFRFLRDLQMGPDLLQRFGADPLYSDQFIHALVRTSRDDALGKHGPDTLDEQELFLRRCVHVKG